MFKSLKFLPMITILLLMNSCTKKNEETTQADVNKPQLSEEDQVNSLAVSQEWSALWKEADQFTTLKAFQKKHGLFLETNEKVGTASLVSAEGPCGETYVSLVKDSQKLIEKVWEIDTKGKVLKEWNPGTEEFLGIEQDTLYRKVKFFEIVSDYSQYSNNTNSERIEHDYVLAIKTDHSIELLPSNFEIKNKWEATEMDCPAGLKVESDYKYCVKEKSTNRLFVLQRTCT